jgi:DNA-binding GntR family transcriptional regulator
MTTGVSGKVNKAESIYRSLKAEIEQGVFAPGQTLGEVMLVERTGASRTPVREALRRLAADGLVDFTPRLGATVARISLQSARELFDFRMVLEPAAMRLVAARVSREPGLRDTFVAFDTRLAQLRTEPPSEDRIRRFYQLAEEFDRAVAAATPNSYLARTILELRPHTARLRKLAHSAPERMEVSLVEHQLMCHALMDGDPEAAAATCRDHLQQTVETIFDSLLTDSRVAIDLGA